MECLNFYGTALLCQIGGPADVAINLVRYRGGLLAADFAVHNRHQSIIRNFFSCADLEIYPVVALRGFVSDGRLCKAKCNK